MQRQFRHAPDLRTVINAPRILTESRFLSVAQQIWAADMVVMAHFRAAKAREIAFRLVRAGFPIRVGFGVVDVAPRQAIIQPL